MTADELIAYIRGAIKTTKRAGDMASMVNAVEAIREGIDKYDQEKKDMSLKNCSDAIDVQKAQPHIPSIIPYKNNPPITPPTWPGHVPDKFWLNGTPMANTGDYR